MTVTTAEFIASGLHRDFLSIDGTAFLIPFGYSVEPTPVETANVKTMASGRKRKDLIRLSTKFKLTWAVAMQDALDDLLSIYDAAATAESIVIYLHKETSGHVGHAIDLVNPVKYKPRNRSLGLFIYESVTLELE